jgi:tubulin alpha
MMDLEPLVGDRIRKGSLRHFFNPNTILTGKEDAANNFSRGYQLGNSNFITDSLDQIRKQVECCDSLQGFNYTFSLGGGTGSGYTTNLLKNMKYYYPKKIHNGFALMPSLHSGSNVLEPYNFILSFELLTDYLDMITCFDNASLNKHSYNIYNSNRINFQDINRVMAQVMSSTTSSTRFEKTRILHLQELQMNMVPFKSLRFLSPSFIHHDPFDDLNFSDKIKFSESNLASSLFEPQNFLNEVNSNMGRFLTSTVLLRGPFSEAEVQGRLTQMRESKIDDFVSWCPTGFGVWVTQRPSLNTRTAVASELGMSGCVLANTSGFRFSLRKIMSRFDKMFHFRSFVHWFVGAGAVEGEFYSGREMFEYIEKDLLEVEKD